MICASNPCGCAIVSDSLTIVSGDGNQGSPWKIESNAFQVVTSVTRPSSPALGWHIYETDTKRDVVWDGSNWVIVGGAFPEVVCTTPSTDAPQVVTSGGSAQPMVLLHEVVDSNGFHTGTSGTYTVPAGMGGRYTISAACAWQANTDGYRLLLASVGSNTSTPNEIVNYRSYVPAVINTANAYQVLSQDDVTLEAGATVGYSLFQTSGIDLNAISLRASLRMTRHIPSLT